jgi:phosphatidylglycerophosphatase A
LKSFNQVIATFFGIGKIPWAPGTWASIAAVPCFYFLIDKPLIHFGVLVVVYFLGVYTSTKMEKEIGEIDPSSAVIDEVLGMGVAMLITPNVVGIPRWPFVLMALILFRIFDIWKPYPIRKFEKLPGGWGIMTDDLAAGVYARVWLQIGAWIVHWL